METWYHHGNWSMDRGKVWITASTPERHENCQAYVNNYLLYNARKINSITLNDLSSGILQWFHRPCVLQGHEVIV